MKNPFRPTAGATPPQVLGRSGLLDEFSYGLDIGAGAPGLLTIFTGARGVGKTVMLGEAHDVARRAGWAVIAETATAGFVARIGEAMRKLAEELGDGPKTRRITGISAAGFGITTALPPEHQVDWREIGVQLLTLLHEHGTGLVITVDEIHAADRGELSQLAAVTQHFIQAQLPIALVFAGLPAAVSDLLNEGVATFLRRADKYDLQAAAVAEVEDSYLEIFGEAGVKIDGELIRYAARSTDGYPFLIQLIGYYLWRTAEAKGMALDAKGVHDAVAAAFRRNERSVIEAALSAASDRDMDFLQAMAQDVGVSMMSEVASRMKASPSLTANYRTRLVEQGLVEAAGRGKVEFAIPGLREYLLKRSG